MKTLLGTIGLGACVFALTSGASAAPAGAPAVIARANPAGAPPAVPLGKLPDAATPLAYRLDLSVDPAQAQFVGHAEIDVRINTPGRYFYLSGNQLAVHSAVAVIGTKRIAATWKQVDDSGVALLTFAEPLPAGAITLTFDYDAPFEAGPDGLFHIKIGDQWYAWTQFESTDARRAYPSFDQPGYKQPFTVTLRTPKGLMAVSNAPETGVSEDGAWEIHHFATTVPLPTYLLAMMVGPFVHDDGQVPPDAERAVPLPLRIITSQNNKDMTHFALTNAPRIVTLLEDYFGQSFPYPKLDLITSPVMPGAMENAGADLFADPILIMTDAGSTQLKREFGMVVAHELAHQWFGDMVTPKWWSDIWLNESFANWMGFRIGNLWRPDLNIGAGALAEGFDAMRMDALLAGRPIHQPITRTNQIDAAFDHITYGKGGQVVAMIAAFMGDDAFRDGVRSYMAAHRYGNASSADFFAAMARTAGNARILPAMQSFTDQQGVPLLTFTPLQGQAGAYTVSQSRYARLGTRPPATHWGVPICVRQLGGVRTCQLLDTPSASLTLKGTGAIMPNAGGTGYYRFELPKADWDRLIDASATLPGGEGLALSDSLFASFEAGRAHASQLFRLALIMAKSPDSYANTAAMDNLESLNHAGYFTGKAQRAYRALVAKIYAPRLSAMGFDPRTDAYTGQNPETSQKRNDTATILAQEAHDAGLRARLVAAAKAWLAGDKGALDPSWYGLAFRTLAQEGDLTTVKTMFARGLASQDVLARPALLGMAARSGHLTSAQWLLAQKDARLRQSEKFWVLMGVATTPATRDFGYAWVRDHLAILMRGDGGIFFAARLPQIANGYCSTTRADAIAHDFGAALKGTTAELDLARTVESVRDCGLLKEARGAQAARAISSKMESSGDL